MQSRILDLFKESLQQAASSSDYDDPSVQLFQQKAADCVRVMREYCVRRSLGTFFNSYLRAFKIYLANETKSHRASSATLVETFWQKHFADSGLSLITNDESLEETSVNVHDAKEFVKSLVEVKESTNDTKVDDLGEKESVEDLLDMM